MKKRKYKQNDGISDLDSFKRLTYSDQKFDFIIILLCFKFYYYIIMF